MHCYGKHSLHFICLGDTGGSSVRIAGVSGGGSGSLSFDEDDDEEDAGPGRKKAKRGILPKHATTILKSWLFQHIVVSLF